MCNSHYTMKKYLLFILAIYNFGFSQPYTDIVNINYQHFSLNQKNNPDLINSTDNYSFNLFFPKEFNNGNVFLVRFNFEMIQSKTNENVSNLSSFSLPIGFQWISKSKKWKTIVMGIPKIASNFEQKMSSNDIQYGGLFLENYLPNDKLKFKAGLYYNKEAFGNFFVPLLGVDWKASDRLNFFGILPTNYKIEYNLVEKKLYTGINFKAATRSFNLSNTNEYVRFDEMILKVFTDYLVYKDIVLSAELGYSLGKNPLIYNFDSNSLVLNNPVYTRVDNYLVFNFGIAYRIRKE